MRALLLVCGILIGCISGQVRADACNGNFWQPTFVHDLEQPDGPWFVMPDGRFTKLRGDSNTWVAQSCDLIGKYSVRDQRGFTSCQDYTRVQCGCSRAVPGNSTCAAFLAAHPAPVTGAMGPLEYDTNRGGGDYNNPWNEAATPDPAMCRARCEQDGRCHSFTWVRPGVQGPVGRCWLKGTVRDASPDRCCVSGAR
jgi:hypothetical protein